MTVPQVPFSEEARRVATALKHLRKRLLVSLDPAADDLVTTRHERTAARLAQRADKELTEPDPVTCQLINVWSLEHGVAVV